MTALVQVSSKAQTMTSLELLKLVNQSRKEFGESQVRHADFAASEVSR